MEMNRSAKKLNADRGLLKFIIFSIITFGIYPIVYYSSVSTSINTLAGHYDGRKTMHYCLLFFILTPITLGIAQMVWFHKVSGRISRELARRGLSFPFGAGTYWGWNILGSLIIVGPFIYIYRLSIAMNLLCADFNERG